MILKPSGTLEILKEVGIVPHKQNGHKSQISSVLDSAGLTREELVEQLKEDLRSENPTTHHSAVKLGLQLHGDLKEAENTIIPQITFVIQSDKTDILAILTPRE